MYKFLLCVQYLRTRYLAIVCVVSVMLGVATLIVVNSVMSGFSNKLKDRLHGVLSDVIVDTERFAGFPDKPADMVRRIEASAAGKHVEAIAPTVEVIGTAQYKFNKWNTVKPVKLLGIDPAKQIQVGPFGQYLVNQKPDKVPVPSFDLSPAALRQFAENRMFDVPEAPKPKANTNPGAFLESPKFLDIAPPPAVPAPNIPVSAPVKPVGVIVGYSLAHFAYKDPKTGEPKTVQVLRPGDEIFLATLGAAGEELGEIKPVYGTYVVADYFKSEMSEYDNQFIYMPLEELQRLRGMQGGATHLQIKLKNNMSDDFAKVKAEVTPEIQSLFSPYEARVSTWQEQQGPLLAAIDIERGILNLLLFMIVGVAGFSILAIFTMIVSEKIRDIGILKSLGAGSGGVMGIFVWYAVVLGTVGCLLGTALGLGITHNINEIEIALTKLTGHQLFDRSVYYFDKIPTQIEPVTVFLVNAGAMLVAVLSSVIPAIRAARLTPIRALRFE